ncbi:MAG: SsrA-binding protein SmpB [Proteobacteria bacterium]|jgi:SsrA-binding protein|nr:SsrA-binding protein SmpB [Pseudomonadota bacterium]
MGADIVTNRKALRDFQILETFEAGVSLLGTEVKSLRAGRADLLGCYAKVEKKGVVLYDATIQVYEKASHETHDPKRPRLLLLNKVEITRLLDQTTRKGLALPVLRMYWKKGRVKVELGLGKGKNAADQRQDLKKKVEQRETDREVARFKRSRG